MTTMPASKPAGHDHGHAHDDPHAHGHDHPKHLAHHWDSLDQQFEAGKLGMWLFLATEVLLFGGLFCAYSIWRGNHPELFQYGSKFLNTTMGATNTVVLILSSLTMAWGVTAAQQNKIGLLKLMLILTWIGAATFMVIKYFEYSHKFHEGWFPGVKFYDVPGEHSHTFQRADGHGEAAHGAAAVPHTDAPAATPSTHDTSPTAGEHATAPAATPGEFTVTTISVTASGAGAAGVVAGGAQGMPAVEAPTFATAAVGPSGLDPSAPLVEEPFKLEQRHVDVVTHPLQDPHRPLNTHMFFNIYFMMTGLHGIHVLIGMIVITWLFIRTCKGHFNSEYFTPIDLGGLYWHVVDLIWIFLFPLFYLI